MRHSRMITRGTLLLAAALVALALGTGRSDAGRGPAAQTAEAVLTSTVR